MSIAKISEAADILRMYAKRATPGPWEPSVWDSGHSRFEFSAGVITKDYGDSIFRMEPIDRIDFNAKYAKDDGSNDAYYIAMMNPLVGLALADWLDDVIVRAGTGQAIDHNATIIAEIILKNL